MKGKLLLICEQMVPTLKEILIDKTWVPQCEI